jgi:hypothetical protein
MPKSRSESLLFPLLGKSSKVSYGAGSWVRLGEESTMPGPGRGSNVVAQFYGATASRNRKGSLK